VSASQSETTTASRAPADRLHYPDLGATVHRGHVPQELPEELPDLYSSLSSTLDWFVTQDQTWPNGACTLEEPRHVVLLHHDGDTINVLNRAFACEPREAQRICRALLRAYPGVQRIRLEVGFPPSQLSLPHRIVEALDYMVIDLPGSADAYYQSLGKSTRKTIRGYTNRLQRAYPDVRTEVVEPGARCRELVDQVVEWKIQRFREGDRITYWDTNRGLADRVTSLLQRCGWVRITSIGGAEVAIHLCFRVGSTAFALEGAHDPAYEDARLGFLTMYQAVCAAADAGATHFSGLEGSTQAKTLLGAKPVPAVRLSVFRSQLSRLYSLDEAGRAARRRGLAACYELAHWAQRWPAGRALADFVKRVRLARWNKSRRA
jgi:hypothetical protein